MTMTVAMTVAMIVAVVAVGKVLVGVGRLLVRVRVPVPGCR